VTVHKPRPSTNRTGGSPGDAAQAPAVLTLLIQAEVADPREKSRRRVTGSLANCESPRSPQATALGWVPWRSGARASTGTDGDVGNYTAAHGGRALVTPTGLRRQRDLLAPRGRQADEGGWSRERSRAAADRLRTAGRSCSRPPDRKPSVAGNDLPRLTTPGGRARGRPPTPRNLPTNTSRHSLSRDDRARDLLMPHESIRLSCSMSGRNLQRDVCCCPDDGGHRGPCTASGTVRPTGDRGVSIPRANHTLSAAHSLIARRRSTGCSTGKRAGERTEVTDGQESKIDDVERNRDRTRITFRAT